MDTKPVNTTPIKINLETLKIIANDSAKVHKRQHDFAANAYLQYAENSGQLTVYQST